MVEKDDFPWVSIIFKALELHQDGVPWGVRLCRMCVPYQNLNKITHPFEYPFQIFEDTNIHISKSTYYILVGLEVDIGWFWWILCLFQSWLSLELIKKVEENCHGGYKRGLGICRYDGVYLRNSWFVTYLIYPQIIHSLLHYNLHTCVPSFVAVILHFLWCFESVLVHT